MPSQDDGGEDMHRGNQNQHDLESAITSVASMTKNVSAIALNTKIESAKPLYSVGVLTRLESGWRHGSIN